MKNIEIIFIETLGMIDTNSRCKHYIRIFLEQTGLKHKHFNLKNWFTFWHREHPCQKIKSQE